MKRRGYGLILLLVMTFYSKSAAKGSNHNHSTDSSNIMAISNIGVQVFEHLLGSQFREIPSAQALHVKRWDFLPPQAFLSLLVRIPEVIPIGLKISSADMDLFRAIQHNTGALVNALKAFNSRSKTVATDDADEIDE